MGENHRLTSREKTNSNFQEEKPLKGTFVAIVWGGEASNLGHGEKKDNIGTPSSLAMAYLTKTPPRLPIVTVHLVPFIVSSAAVPSDGTPANHSEDIPRSDLSPHRGGHLSTNLFNQGEEGMLAICLTLFSRWRKLSNPYHNKKRHQAEAFASFKSKPYG